MFNDSVDKFITTVDVGEVYTFHKVRTEIQIDKRYKKGTVDFTVKLSNYSTVVKTDYPNDIPEMSIEAVTDLLSLQTKLGENVNIIGIVLSCGELTEVKNNSKNEITIVDKSNAVVVTLWNDVARETKVVCGQVVCIQQTMVISCQNKITCGGGFVSQAQPYVESTFITDLEDWFKTTNIRISVL